MKKGIALLSLLFLCLTLVNAQDLPPASVTFKTAMKTGERITIRLAANPADVIIDWGDGAFAEIKVKSTFDSTPTSVGYTLTVDSPTIRIWGRLVNFHAHTSKLTSMVFGGNQWDQIRRIDCQNNLLTSLVFPSDAGFNAKSIGTINAYNNNFDVCAVENLYKSLVDKTGLTTSFGGLFLTGNGSTVEGVGNEAQNAAVKEHSKISYATARQWYVYDNELSYTEALANPIQESPTAKGCETSSVNMLSIQNDFICFYNASNSIITVKMNENIIEPTQIVVYDAMGRSCYTQQLTTNETHISSSSLNKGVYFVKVGKIAKKVVL